MLLVHDVTLDRRMWANRSTRRPRRGGEVRPPALVIRGEHVLEDVWSG